MSNDNAGPGVAALLAAAEEQKKEREAEELAANRAKCTISALRAAYPEDDKINNALDVIARLAAEFGINVANWNVVKLFSIDENTGESNTKVKLISDPIEIEKIVRAKSQRPPISIAKETSEEKEAVAAALVDSLAGMHNRLNQSRLAARKGELEAEIDYFRAQTKMAVESAWQHISGSVQSARKLAAMEDGDGPQIEAIRVEVEKVLNAGFWTDLRVDGTTLWVRTTNPIILSHRNNMAGIDRHVNLGHFAARVALGNTQVTAFACGGNTVVNGRSVGQCHPHILDHGKICLGYEESVRYADASSKYEIAAALAAIQAALTGYDNDSTYIPLEQFETHGVPLLKYVKEKRAAWETPYKDCTDGAVYVSVAAKSDVPAGAGQEINDFAPADAGALFGGAEGEAQRRRR